MNPKITDVQATLKYGREKMGRTLLVMGLIALFLGLAIVIYSDDRELLLPGWVCLIVGGLLTAYEFYKTANPGKPLLEISPRGITFRIEMVKEIFIPWHQIHGVESIDVTGEYRGRAVPFNNVTAILVSKHFYDTKIHVDSLLLRGPGWENIFIPSGGGMVHVAFHEEILPATSAELRTAIETRWIAFRENKPAAAPRPGGSEAAQAGPAQ